MLEYIDFFGEKTVLNTWEPEPLNMDIVKRECRFVQHDLQQNVCIFLEHKKYLEDIDK